jgi:hypothetical protein
MDQGIATVPECKTCPHCGVKFGYGKFGVGKKYCSSNCRYDARRLRWEASRLHTRIRNRLTPEKRAMYEMVFEEICKSMDMKFVKLEKPDYVLVYNTFYQSVRVDVGRQRAGAALVFEQCKDGSFAFRATCSTRCPGCPKCGVALTLNTHGKATKAEGVLLSAKVKEEYEERRERRVRVKHHESLKPEPTATMPEFANITTTTEVK